MLGNWPANTSGWEKSIKMGWLSDSVPTLWTGFPNSCRVERGDAMILATFLSVCHCWIGFQVYLTCRLEEAHTSEESNIHVRNQTTLKSRLQSTIKILLLHWCFPFFMEFLNFVITQQIFKYRDQNITMGFCTWGKLWWCKEQYSISMSFYQSLSIAFTNRSYDQNCCFVVCEEFCDNWHVKKTCKLSLSKKGD